MSAELRRYTEPLTGSELAFLQRKEATERNQYFKTFRMLMFLSFLIPFVGAWYRAYDGAPNAFSAEKFFVTAGILLSISSFSTWTTYRVNLRKVQLDIRYRTKTIESARITRKVYITTKDACHFYIDSAIKLSIEVSRPDYERYKEGDELYIEYTTHSRQYLGYF